MGESGSNFLGHCLRERDEKDIKIQALLIEVL